MSKPITRERLEKRREELKVQFEQVKANLHALAGAIEDLNYLLDEKGEDAPYEKEA